MEARGAEEDDRVLDLLVTEAGEWFGELSHDADQAAITAVQELRVLEGERCSFETWRGAGRLEVSHSIPALQ